MSNFWKVDKIKQDYGKYWVMWHGSTTWFETTEREYYKLAKRIDETE